MLSVYNAMLVNFDKHIDNVGDEMLKSLTCQTNSDINTSILNGIATGLVQCINGKNNKVI